MIQKTILLVLISFLASCSYVYGDKGIIKNRDTEYLKAYSIPPMKVPAGMASDTIQADYPVPYKSYPADTKKPSLIPPGL